METKLRIAALAKKASNRIGALPLLGIVLFVFSTAFPPLDLMAQINLPIHMAQHVLIAVSGVLITYPLYLKRKTKLQLPDKGYAVSSVVVVSTIVMFWHLPAAWDAAVLNPVIHGIEHFSFFAVGLLIGWFFPVLPDNFKFMTIFLAASGHMVYGIYLFIMTTPVYPLYPLNQQVLLGILILFPAPFYFIGSIGFSLHRETKRLEEIELRSSKVPQIRATSSKTSNFGRTTVQLITLLLISVFVGYLIVVSAAIYSSSARDPDGVPVYILETPVTWQYFPQNIIVVIGVNDTVTWVSHSLSEDTVTSNTDLFNSGTIGPGQSWSYTFAQPGTFEYSCEFHPWMKGTVTVLAAWR